MLWLLLEKCQLHPKSKNISLSFCILLRCAVLYCCAFVDMAAQELPTRQRGCCPQLVAATDRGYKPSEVAIRGELAQQPDPAIPVGLRGYRLA